MRQSRFSLIAILASIFVVGGCENAFEDTASKTTNEAVYYQAQRDIDSKKYTEAISQLLSLTDEFKARREVTVTIASAYAGRCGLDFLGLATSISDHPGDPFLALIASNFRTATTDSIADCAEAQRWMKTLAPNSLSELNSDEGVFLAMVSLAKLGAILGTYSDLNHDGLTDAGFDSCDLTKFPELATREAATGITLAVGALAASGGTIGGSALASISATCSTLPPSQNFCGIYDPAAFTLPQLKVINGFVRETSNGVGLSICAGDVTACICP